MNIFSGINNLVDLTLDESCATIRGYTQEDLETSFAEYLAGVDREQLKLWYNGYKFLGEAVYNPFDILLFIANGGLFRNYWFETGTPTFLVTAYTQAGAEKERYADATYDALLAGDLAALEAGLRRLFAGIPWRNFTNNDLAEYEGYYASVLYAFFMGITCTVTPEDISNHGQVDLTIRLADNIYVMEIKTVPAMADDAAAASTTTPPGTAAASDAAGNKASNSALAQIRAMGYADKYLGQAGVRVFELGLLFSMAKRNLVQFAGTERGF